MATGTEAGGQALHHVKVQTRQPREPRLVLQVAVLGNDRDCKVATLRAATEWIARALVALLVLAALATTYALFGPEPQSAKQSTPPARTTP